MELTVSENVIISCGFALTAIAADVLDTILAVADDVFGDGCGTAAGAGLADDCVGGWGLGDTMLPGFAALRPRKLCNQEKYMQMNKWNSVKRQFLIR